MIQRGRGACHGQALVHRAAGAGFVVDCIVHDPRWDHQVEQRDWLYATLVAELGVDLSQLRAAYAGPLDPYGDSDAWLATSVLTLLARRGVADAVAELRRYLRSGRDLEQALDHLIPLLDRPETEGLLDDVLEAADDEQLRSLLEWRSGYPGGLSAPPWPDWRRASTRIEQAATVAERSRAARSNPRFDRAARDRADREHVLRAAAESHLATAPSAPDEVSGERWETTLLGIAADILQDETHPDAVRIAVRRCLRTLGAPRTLAWARTHVTLDGYAGSTARSLFADLAEISDAPRLHELLTEALARGNDHIYDQCNLVDALARLGHGAGVTTIEEIFDTTVYSYLRSRCALALSRLSTDFADERAVECLDDCESRTRRIAIAHANISVPEVSERFGRIAQDPTENGDNRRAAATRIIRAAAGGTGYQSAAQSE
jgi:hypothetical protein